MSSISFTVPQLTEESRLEAPTPMMAVVFVWVVLTGTPVRELVVSKGLLTGEQVEQALDPVRMTGR